jgi:type IV pilus assembly protein PilW
MMRPRRLQSGMTLVEILVALAVTSFLMIGLFTIVQTTLQASNNQGALSQLQDNERLAMQRIADVVQQAGYFTGPLVNTANGALPAATVTLPSGQVLTFASGQGVFGTHSATMPQDSITVRYYGGTVDGLINCDGSTVSTVAVYYNTFTLDGSGNLQCTLTSVIGGSAPVFGTPVTLVTGVQDMVISYGTSSSATCVSSFSATANPVDTYYKTGSMAASNWCGVISVQLALVFTNPLYNGSGPFSQQYPQQLPFIQLTRLINVMSHI